MIKAYRKIFDNSTTDYAVTQRLSSACALWIVKTVKKTSSREQISQLLDVGGGDGYMACLFGTHAKVKNYIIADISKNMLVAAIGRSNKCNLQCKLKLLQSDAETLPISSGTMPIILMSFVLHLLQNPIKALLEIERVLKPNGNFFLVTYDPLDLVNQIYHKYFPRYCEIDLARFLDLQILCKMIEWCGFKSVLYFKKTFKVYHHNVDETISLLKKKPFSALAKYTDTEFARNLEVFERRLRTRFGQGSVISQSKITLVSAKKNS